MREQTIWDLIYPKYKIDKPIRLISLFSGYDSQALALKYLGVDFTHWATCEWAIKSIKALNDIHFQDHNDYSESFDIEYIKEWLFEKGISSNWNEPMTKQQINRMSEKQARDVFNNIIATRNLVNIQQVKGKDLEITDTDKYCYIMTYSFPCQDLSLAGKGKGMSDTSTRSGMLWEVERILTELEEKPQVLLMENVPQVHSEDNKADFLKWITRLEELGYQNYWKDLIATDYGIPQTRNRCFMVSILGDYSYSFPPKQELKLKLKDMLDDQAPEKYYLSDKMINCFLSESKDSKFPRKERFLQTFNTTNENSIAATITTCAGTRATDNFINVVGNYSKSNHEASRILGTDGVAPTFKENHGTINAIMVNNKGLRKTLEQNEIEDTCYIDTYNKRIDKEKSGTITTGVSFRNNTFLAIKNATKQGYLEATEGDGVDISSRMKYHRGTVQKGKAQTLTTSGGGNIGVVVK